MAGKLQYTLFVSCALFPFRSEGTTYPRIWSHASRRSVHGQLLINRNYNSQIIKRKRWRHSDLSLVRLFRSNEMKTVYATIERAGPRDQPRLEERE